MVVNNNDVIEFVAISWDDGWEFDHPTVVLKPVIQYSPNGDPCESLIEDMAINLSCGDDLENEDISDEFEWRGWSLSRLKKVVKDRIAGKQTWKTKIREIVIQKIRFFEKDDEMEFEVLEIKRY